VVRGAGSKAWPHPAKIRLHAPAATIAEQLASAAGLLQPDGERASILETGSDSLYDLVAFLSSLEVAFTVIEPPELRELLATLAARFQAATREPRAGRTGSGRDVGS
jgi:hypothetical protein